MSGPVETAPSPSGSSDDEAWSLVLASWADEEAHRTYLSRFTDLEGLAVAGGRYRAILARTPDDPVALRMRDELVKKATVYGLAALPHTNPAGASSLTRRLRMAAALAFGCAAVWAVYKLFLLLGARF